MKNNLLLRLIALSTVASLPASTASATAVDSPNFNVEPLVIVWAANDADGSVPVVVDFIVDDGAGGTQDLIAADGRTLITSSLIPTTDSTYQIQTSGSYFTAARWRSNDLDGLVESFEPLTEGAFSSFDVTDMSVEAIKPRNETDFYVASNTPFGISGQATEIEATGDFQLSDIRLVMQMRVSENGYHGSAAQDPQGTIIQPGNLGAMTDDTVLYTSTRQTAASAGNIAEQSVRFRMNKFLETPNGRMDLSDGYGEIKAEVVYTVYVL